MVSKSMRVAALAAVLVLPLLLTASGAGAGTKNRLDLSSPAAINAYLTSKGINPATVTWQTGLHNYAGPSCPGIGWTCTTSTKVVQVSAAGGQNKFDCEPEEDQSVLTDEGSNTCVIVQMGDDNKARCKLRDTGPEESQKCDITQTEAERNSADIDMTIEQRTGPEQGADQQAFVHQEASERNQSQVHQAVKQQTSTGDPQTQNAYQLANVTQIVDGSDNFSHIHQTQDQDESGNAAEQNQNTEAQPFCEDKQANQCALVLQQDGGGDNASHLHQAIGEQQSTKAADATQLQGDLPTGQEGAIHQENPDGAGPNADLANQDQRQRASGPGGTTQAQHTGDGKCCGPSQIGGRNNHEFIHQSSTQSASEDSAEQDALLIGEVHQGSDPSNACSIDQHARINDASSHESVSGTDAECLTLFLATTCYSGESVATCTTTQNPCDVPPFCDFSVESTLPLLGLPTSPTFGRDIAMPDYTSEPSGYVDPGGWW